MLRAEAELGEEAKLAAVARAKLREEAAVTRMEEMVREEEGTTGATTVRTEGTAEASHHGTRNIVQVRNNSALWGASVALSRE